MALKPLTPTLTARPPLPGAPPAPIKGEHPPRASPHLSPLSFSLSRSSSLPLTERRHHRAFPVVARPPRRRSSSDEALIELPVPPSPFCAPAGEFRRTGAAGGRVPVSVPPCPLSAPTSIHGGPSAPGRSTETWTRCTNYLLGNNSLFRIFQKSCKEVPGLLGNQPAVQILPILHSGPRVFFEINPRSGIFAVRSKFEKYLQKGP
jgi:hypothetical protein